MSSKKKIHVKSKFHLKNRNKDKYDLSALVLHTPELESHIITNIEGESTVDFTNPTAINLLNKALLGYYYDVKSWNFPDDYICPQIPKSADYIHHIADLLKLSNFGRLPKSDLITCLDIGTGATCIFPILGSIEYNWNFIGSDIDDETLKSASEIVASNPTLPSSINFKLQENPKDFFYGILDRKDKVDITLCSPPTLSPIKGENQPKELLYDGGDLKFNRDMIKQSKKFASNCFWFTTIVSSQNNLKNTQKLLDELGAIQVIDLPLENGKKGKKILAWSFLGKSEQNEWRTSRWGMKKKIDL